MGEWFLGIQTFWESLWSHSQFMTHAHCFMARQDLVTRVRNANFLIFFSYSTIPLSLVWLWWKRRGKDPIIVQWFVWFFALFIVWCGFGHLLDYYALGSQPMYVAKTIVVEITAGISLLVAVLFFSSLSTLAKYPSISDYFDLLGKIRRGDGRKGEG